MSEIEFKTNKSLENAANAIQNAILNGNIVWISTASGDQVLLDDTCKIGFMYHR